MKYQSFTIQMEWLKLITNRQHHYAPNHSTGKGNGKGRGGGFKSAACILKEYGHMLLIGFRGESYSLCIQKLTSHELFINLYNSLTKKT